MLEWLIALHRMYVDEIIIVVHPSSEREVREFGGKTGARLAYEIQSAPTGMLDAILLARDRVGTTGASHVWVTWCDQVAVHPQTVRNLAEQSAMRPHVPLVMPTVMRDDPYIHFARDTRGRITSVLQRREGDVMPARGESDMGLFSLSREAFLDELPAFAANSLTGGSSGERNFLPFIPWIAERSEIVTFPGVDEMEAVGVNTPSELEAVARYLALRERRAP
jgi:NDP-sugar pyrophosphorylase family protein